MPFVPIGGCNAFDEDLLDGQATVDPLCTDGDEQPPTRVAVDDPGEDVPDFWIALKEVQLDQSDDDLWARTGFNLDNRCTTAEATSHECIPLRGETAPVQTDGVRGIDNTFGGALFPILSLAFEDLDVLAQQAEEKGIGALAARIRGWNGQANDTTVEVLISQTVFGTPGANGTPPNVDIVGFEGRHPTTGDLLPFPNWDGDDFFWIRDDTFLLPDAMTIDEARPLVVDTNAYVTNGQIVATIADGTEIILVGEGLATLVRLSDVSMVLDILSMSTAPRDEGQTVTIGGRWGYTDLLRTAESVGVCPDSPLFPTLDTQLRGLTDTLLDPDGAAEGARCDAVSIGITFEAYFANIGGLTDGQPLPDPCGADADMGVAADMGRAADMGAPVDMGGLVPADMGGSQQ